MGTSTRRRALWRAIDHGLLGIVLLMTASTAALAAHPGHGSIQFDLEQCANDAPANPRAACTWQHGNLNGSNSQYGEGDSVAYRATVDGLTIGNQYELPIGWDFLDGTDIAFDYLTSWHCTEAGAPAAGAPTSILPIPAITSGPVSSVPQDGHCTNAGPHKQFEMWGGTLTGTGAYGGTAGQPTLPVQFTATATTVVLAWGGHISTRNDWAPTGIVAGTNGSSYHMRLDGALQDLTTPNSHNIGQMDRSLQSSAVELLPDLVFAKDGPASVGPGDAFDYLLTLDNLGRAASGDVTITDKVPAGFTVTGIATSSGTCDPISGQDVSCDVGSIGAGGTVAVTVSVTAPDACDVHRNEAAFVERRGESGSAHVVTSVDGCLPDVTIEKTTSTPTVTPGATASWTLKVANDGNAPATTVEVTDDVPADFSGATGTWTGATAGACTGTTTLTCAIGTLDPGDEVEVVIQATAARAIVCGDRNNEGVVTWDPDGRAADDVDLTITGCAQQLTVTKQASSATAAQGDPITWTVSVSSSGTVTVTDVEVTDDLDNLLTGVVATWLPDPAGIATPTACLVAAVTNVVSCDVGDLVPGLGATVTITANAPTGPNTCGPIPNVAIAEGVGVGATASNPAPVTVTDCEPLLSLDKANTGPAQVGPGGTATFTITVANTGTLDATQVQVDEVVPVGWTLTALDPAAACDLATASCVVDVPVGQPAVLTATMTAPGGNNACATYENTALAPQHQLLDTATVDVVGCGGTPPPPPPPPAPPPVESPNIVVTVRPDVILVEWEAPVPVVGLVGDTFTAQVHQATHANGIIYSYVVTNTGDVTLTDVTATDDVFGPLVLTTTTLAPGQQAFATVDHTVTAEQFAVGFIVDVVTATGISPQGVLVNSRDDARVDIIAAPEVLGEVEERPDPAPAPEPLPAPLPQVEPDVVERLPVTGSHLDVTALSGLALLALGHHLRRRGRGGALAR